MGTNFRRSASPRVETEVVFRCPKFTLQRVGTGRVTPYNATTASTKPVTVGIGQVGLVAASTTVATVIPEIVRHFERGESRVVFAIPGEFGRNRFRKVCELRSDDVLRYRLARRRQCCRTAEFALLHLHSNVARETEPAAIGPPRGGHFRIGTAWLSLSPLWLSLSPPMSSVPKSAGSDHGCP